MANLASSFLNPTAQKRATAPRPSPRIAPDNKKTLPKLGQILLEMGELSPGDLLKAVAIRAREDVRIGTIFLSYKMVGEAALYDGLAQQFACQLADFSECPPDMRLLEQIGPAFCLQNGIVPWKHIGASTLIATSRPEDFADLCGRLPPEIKRPLMVIAPERKIEDALLAASKTRLVIRAETRVELVDSCRGWDTGAMTRFSGGVLTVLALGILFAPIGTLLALTSWAILALLLNAGLKAAAAWTTFRFARSTSTNFASRRHNKPAMRLPRVSILVPLFREREIAGRLIRRLSRLNYPRELLDINLIVEQEDTVTQAALTAANLPPWMRQISVPPGNLKTKPRALNFALDFCKGSIIGVYDAEDAPEPDQLHKIARRFHESPAEVACLQGVLDFYNSRTNWLSRCFTVEYATWFRVVLPGLERLGLVVPLGGTTIFFRREALEEVGGWDAYNVTEDADLGIRLARRGYRTELVDCLTEEEANCHFLPWIKQRSRWLKGFAITWAVHMRDPGRLYRDLGARQFLGLQILFLGTLSQFILAPLLWSFWAVPLGLTHPLQAVLSPTVFYLLTGVFFASEFVTLAVGAFALSPDRHRRLWYWIPTLHLYFPLATLAAYKGIWELLTKPFYWDKTEHGHSLEGRKRAAGSKQFWRGFSRSHPRRLP